MVNTALTVGLVFGVYLLALGVILRAHHVARRSGRIKGLDDD